MNAADGNNENGIRQFRGGVVRAQAGRWKIGMTDRRRPMAPELTEGSLRQAEADQLGCVRWELRVETLMLPQGGL